VCFSETIFEKCSNIFGMALRFIFAPQWYFNWLGAARRRLGDLDAASPALFHLDLACPGRRRRYSLNAKFTVLAQITIDLYWFWLVYVDRQTRSFLRFGILDCVYATFNGILLWIVLRKENDPLTLWSDDA